MGWFDGISGLGLASLGMGVAGDIFGAYSQSQAAQRQRDLYNQYLQQQMMMQDPAYMLRQAQPYYDANVAALQKAIPSIMTSTINPNLGGRGIDPMGGLGQNIIEQAIAPYYMQAWDQAQRQAYNQQGLALNALGGATGNVGMPSGQLGGTANAMNSLMFYNALQKNQSPSKQPTPTPGMTDTSGLGGSYTNTSNPYNLDFGVGDLSSGYIFGNPEYYR